MKKFIQLVIILITLSFLTACTPAEQTINFKVLSKSTSCGFTGYYIKNGGNIINFGNSVCLNGINSYEASVDDVDNIRISVSSKEPLDTTSITILIYKDNELVKEAENSGQSTLVLKYVWDEEKTSDDTSTTIK